jgi:hypothetical protein
VRIDPRSRLDVSKNCYLHNFSDLSFAALRMELRHIALQPTWAGWSLSRFRPKEPAKSNTFDLGKF